MKASLILLLATVIPLGWVVLGVILVCRFVLLNRCEAKSMLMSASRAVQNVVEKWIGASFARNGASWARLEVDLKTTASAITYSGDRAEHRMDLGVVARSQVAG